MADNFCIFADDIAGYNVFDNDPCCIPPLMCNAIVEAGMNQCVTISPNGHIVFLRDPVECCVQTFTMIYLVEQLQGQFAEVEVTVKCPKPDCANVELPLEGADATIPGGNGSGCLSSCENSIANYSVNHTVGNIYSWSVIGAVFRWASV